MSLDELHDHLKAAAWFSRVGTFDEPVGTVALHRVVAADTWDWLPTSPDQPDPVHGETLVRLAEQGGLTPARKAAELATYKMALVSLRVVPDRHPPLVEGPHDYTPAAKGAALYAARRAAREIVVGRPGFWCSLIPLYRQGNWPCGLLDDTTQVVVL